MFDFDGKNVVYVGGFGGVGYQACHILMQKKINHLVICSRIENVEMLKKLQAMNATVNVSFVHINLLDRASIEHAVEQIGGIVKHIDVLVNGAGVLADKDVETTIGVNLTGLIYTTLACIPYIDKTQLGHGGIVVNISSVFGIEPASAFAVYAAAKHGVVGFTRSLADEHYYAKTGISFVCVCPGLTATELMINMRDLATFEHHSKEFLDIVAKSKQQKPDECAANVVKALTINKNGGLYLCHAGQLKEITPTMYWHL